MRVLSRAGGTLRQWRHPREFRIQASAWPENALRELVELARAEAAHSPAGADGGARPVESRPDGGTGPGGLSGRSLADMATSLWRLRTRIERMDDAPRAIVRHLETAWDALTDAGVEIKDHTGEPFDLGLAMLVVAYQPTPGLSREQIIETVQPGVYLGDVSIQLAKVIVGTPDQPPTTPAKVEGTRTR